MLTYLRSRRGVAHLHGRYDAPGSVVLSSKDYQRLTERQQDATAVVQALFYSGVLLFVGTSLDGLSDPHLGRMLEQFRALHGPTGGEEATPHFFLAREGISPREIVRLRRLGIVTVTFGKDFDDLPRFIMDNLVQKRPVTIRVDDVRSRINTVRNAESLEEALQDIGRFIENEIYVGRKVRLAFVKKCTEDGRDVLKNEYVIPPDALRHVFSYPQTLAAWALIEGQIFAYPSDLGRRCDFGLLQKLHKYDRVDSLLKSDPGADPEIGKFLDAKTIKDRAGRGELTIEDLYQNWMRGYPVENYKQFVSVPVPIIERIPQSEPEEYGVFNIDTPEEDPPLVTEKTLPLLKLASDLAALCFRRLKD